jgi:hypothetical protein
MYGIKIQCKHEKLKLNIRIKYVNIRNLNSNKVEKIKTPHNTSKTITSLT